MDVGSVPGEKDPSLPEVAGQSMLGPNRLHPTDIYKSHGASGLAGHDCDQVCIVISIRRNDAPTSRGERKAEHDSGAPKKGMSGATFEIIGWTGIAYHDGSAIVTSPESGPDQRPNDTVGAITSCDVRGHNPCVGTFRTVNPALHAVFVLQQPFQLASPLDLHS